MIYEDQIEQLELEIKQLKAKQSKEQKQEDINKKHTFKITCSCGAETILDTMQREIEMTANMSCEVFINCRGCGKKWKRDFWC